MRRSRWRGHRTGFGVFLVGTGMGMITNLVTGDVERWPAVLQPIATYAPALGALLVVGVGAKAWWDVRRGGVERPEWTGSNPYPGLVAYTERWAGVFFGRGPEVDELLSRVRDARSAAGRFVPVVGPSGSGKSSVVLAGLVPALRDGWRVLPAFTPGTNAVGELAGALGVDLSGPSTAALAAARTGEMAPRLDTALAALRELRAGARRVLIVVDQLEETVTQCVEEDRHAFLALLEALLEQEPRLRVVATVRSDTIGEFQQGPGRALFHDPLMVNVMGPREIRQVVREPARLTATTFDDGLADEIVRDAGGGDALPLLSYLLSDLYRNVARDRHISWREYRDSGGVSGAITRRAETAVRDLGPDALEPCLDTLLLFVTLGAGGATRQRVLGSTLDDRQLAVVRAFVEARLLVSDDAAEGVVYDIAHEALLRQWEPLAAHIVRHEEALRRLTELAPMARAWLRSGRQADYLIGGARLADALSWARGRGRALAPEVRDFLDESQRNQAGEMERRANRLAREALATLATDPETACALATAAYTELAPTPLSAYALEMTLARGLLRVIGHPRGVTSVAFDGAGRLATACGEAVVRIWPPVGPYLHTLSGHADSCHAVAFAADGTLATADREGTIRTWNGDGEPAHTWRREGRSMVLAYTVDGHLAVGGTHGVIVVDGELEHPRVLPGQAAHGGVYALASGVDGRVAAGFSDGTVLVWDAAGDLLEEARAHGDCVLAVAFGPDGILASGARDGGIVTWDGTRWARFWLGKSRQVLALAYGPDGTLVAGLSKGGVRLFDRHGATLDVLTDGGEEARALAFAPDGRLAAGYDSGDVRIWDLGGRLVETVDEGVDSVAFAPDGRLAIGYRSGAVSLDGGGFPPLPVSNSPAYAVAVSDDGRLASGHANGMVRIDRPDDATPPPGVRGHGGWLSALLFLPDGRLVSGGQDGTVLLWDGDTAKRLAIGVEPVQGLGRSPDGAIAVHRGASLRWIDVEGRWVDRTEHTGVAAAAMAPDGRWAVGRTDGVLELCRPGAPTKLIHSGHDGPLRALAFAPDGRLASATRAGEMRIWDTEGELLYTFVDNAGSINALAFAPDGRLAVLAGEMVRVWPYDTPGEILTALVARHRRLALTGRQRESAMLAAAREGDG